MPRGPAKSRKDQLWLLPSEGEPRHGLLAECALRLRTWQIFTYAVPPEMEDRVRPGVSVRVPYGSSQRIVEGWCVRAARGEWGHTHKPIHEVAPEPPVLTEPLIELALWLSEYYVAPPGKTLDQLVPSAVRMARPRIVRVVRATGETDERRITAKQQAVLDALQIGEQPMATLLKSETIGRATITTLQRRGLVEVLERAADSEALKDETETTSAFKPCPEDDFALTAGQRAALDAVRTAADAAEFAVLLLFGVPGSGKTEVYVRAIRAVIAAGRQAIVLVPEIALATQVVERLARRFERVAVLHSRLTPRTRAESLRRIAAGQADVVIGTRTAVFAPCSRLGLIVVDEEQDSSFKSLSSPFYHARDVAIKRGQIEGVPVLLGSATPAVETWYKAATLGRYHLLRLPDRVPGARLPEVKLLQTERRALGETTTVLSAMLVERLRAVIARGEQAVLLHNRRGYAVGLHCSECGLAVLCPRCGAHLIYHRTDELAKCHRCGAHRPAPKHCLDDTCNGELERSGLGIQRLEEELARVIPTARVQRLDRDTMRKREDYAAALRRFESREADVLIGTQMVAKGLDFPGVCLVGVIDADAGLHIPDYRASEHVFQLLMQVAGRAGRKQGESLALFQCDQPEAPTLQHGMRLDYEGFAAEELAVRKELFDPPFCRLVRFVALDPRASRARTAAQELADGLRKAAGRVHAGIRVDGPDPCVMARLRDRFRFQVVVRTPPDNTAQRLLLDARRQKLLSPSVDRITVDVDPLELL